MNKDQSRWMLPRMIAALGIVIVASASSQVAPKSRAAQSQVQSGAHVYNLHPVAEDKVLTNPSNQWSYFFELRPGIELYPGQSSFALDYTVSKTLQAAQGSLTVSLNGMPVGSRVLPPAPRDSTPWIVVLPDKYFKTGFNEIKVTTRQRSSDQPCRDVDNDANWFKIGTGTALHLVRKNPATFPLASYPFPYLDSLEDNPVQCSLMLPTRPSSDAIANMLDIASDWGKRAVDRGLDLAVATRPQGSPTGKALLVSDKPTWSNATPPGIAPGTGILSVFAANTGAGCLLVTGGDAKGLHNAESALAIPDMVSQMAGGQATVANPPTPSPIGRTARLGRFTFAELGSPSIRLAGAFHQKATVTIRRPLRCNLGRESAINLKFRHSASVNPLRSLITISINGTPIGSSKLDSDNANNGTIHARIPLTELAKNDWVIDISCYHDLGAIDCSKSYDDIAWTVIEGESAFDLESGDLVGRPYLESFPYLISIDGQAPQTTDIALSNDPSDEQLSLAATLAARAAQSNRIHLDWSAKKGEAVGASQSGIVLGLYSEVDRFKPIANQLLVAPTGKNQFKISSNLQLLPSALIGGAVIQAVSAPGTNRGVSYVVLAEDDAAMTRVAHVLADPTRADEIGGAVTIITKDGKIVPLQLQGVDLKGELLSASQSYTPQMRAIMAVVLVLVAALFYWVGKQFVKKKTPPMPFAGSESENKNQ